MNTLHPNQNTTEDEKIMIPKQIRTEGGQIVHFLLLFQMMMSSNI